MPVLATIALDLLLALLLLLSVQVAAAWGELCAIQPGRDPSALGGFAAVFALLAARWLLLAGCLAAAARPGERTMLLAAHAALGVASVLVFHRGLERLQRGRPVPAAVGLLGGVLLPAPACTVAVLRANAPWLGDDGVTAAAAAAAILGLHALPWAYRRAELRARP